MPWKVESANVAEHALFIGITNGEASVVVTGHPDAIRALVRDLGDHKGLSAVMVEQLKWWAANPDKDPAKAKP